MNPTITKLKKRNVSVYVNWLDSFGGNNFPNIVFSADTDMSTIGLGSLTSCEKHEIVVAEYSSDEWKRGVGPDLPASWIQANIDFENRINKQMGRSDLRSIWYISLEPEAMFRDIHSQKGESKRILERQSIDDFFENGGELIDVLHWS